MTAKEYCMNHPAMAYASCNAGLEIHGIEYGVNDYVYAVSGAWAGTAAHSITVPALTTPPAGGRISASGEAVYTLMNVLEWGCKIMLSLSFQARIFTNYHSGQDCTNGRKYRYSIQYNPLALVHTWVIRQPMRGGSWEWVQPLAMNLQFTPRNSTR